MDHFALVVVLRAIHGDEHRQGEVFVLVHDRDARLGAEQLVVLVHLANQVVVGDRPVGPEHAVLAVVNRGFVAQALERRPMLIGLEVARAGYVDLLQRQAGDVLHLRFLREVGDGFAHEAGSMGDE